MVCATHRRPIDFCRVARFAQACLSFETFLAALTFAQRFLCAAAIRARPAALIRRFPPRFEGLAAFTFAHRLRCAAAILARPAALI